jgi:hypothetical protein
MNGPYAAIAGMQESGACSFPVEQGRLIIGVLRKMPHIIPASCLTSLPRIHAWGRADVSEANVSRTKVTPFARRPEKVPGTAFFRFDQS